MSLGYTHLLQRPNRQQQRMALLFLHGALEAAFGAHSSSHWRFLGAAYVLPSVAQKG